MDKRNEKKVSRSRGTDRAYHVLPAGTGGWEVRKEGSSRAAGHFATKAEAVSRAREISRNSGAVMKVHARADRIEQAESVRGGSAPSDEATRKSERVDLRITPKMKALLQRAATASHKNVTEFLLEAGINAAEEALADRRMFQLDDAQWRAFQDALDRPVSSKPRLAKLLAGKSVLE